MNNNHLGNCFLRFDPQLPVSELRQRLEPLLCSWRTVDLGRDEMPTDRLAPSDRELLVCRVESIADALPSLQQWKQARGTVDGCFVFAPGMTLTDTQELSLLGCRGFAEPDDLEVFRRWLAAVENHETESSSIFRRIVQALPDVLVLKDKQGVYVDIFAGPNADVPIDRDAFVGRESAQVLPADLYEQCLVTSAQAFASGQVTIDEMEFPLQDSTRWVEYRSVPLSENELLIVIGDATDKVSRRTALDQNERLLRLAQKISRTGYWEWQVASNETRISSTLSEILGMTESKLNCGMDQVLSRCSHPKDLERTRRVVSESLQARTWTPLEHRIVRPDGDIRTLLTFAYIEPNSSDESFSIVGVCHDVSEMKQVERTLRERERELADIAKVSSIGQVAAQVAHELNQPLFAVTNYAEAIQHSLKAPLAPATIEQIQTWLSKIASLSRDAGGKIRRMTRLLQRNQEHLSEVNVQQLLRDTCQLFDKDLEANSIDVHWRLDPTTGIALVDRVSLQQLFSHLIQNSIDALLLSPQTDRQIFFETALQDDSIMVRITDNGPGFDPESFNELCQPFFSSRAEAPGVGLAICKTITQNMQGRMWAERQPVGISVAVLFPRRPQNTAPDPFAAATQLS